MTHSKKPKYARGVFKTSDLDGRGVLTHRTFEWDSSRAYYDLELLRQGFKQYDPDQDAWYFGVWVHVGNRVVLTYAEGDVTECHCGNLPNLVAMLKDMREFYGPAPRVARCIGDDGKVVDVYTARPGDDLLTEGGADACPS